MPELLNVPRYVDLGRALLNTWRQTLFGLVQMEQAGGGADDGDNTGGTNLGTLSALFAFAGIDHGNVIPTHVNGVETASRNAGSVTQTGRFAVFAAAVKGCFRAAVRDAGIMVTGFNPLAAFASNEGHLRRFEGLRIPHDPGQRTSRVIPADQTNIVGGFPLGDRCGSGGTAGQPATATVDTG
ncbi:hypothetical protein ES705_40065 [subsurface metagenome]